MATLAVQKSSPDTPLTITYAAAAGGGDLFTNDGKTFLYVINASGSSITVTLVGQNNCSQGFKHDSVLSVPNGTTPTILGPFSTSRFNDGANKVHITYSEVTSVTVAVVNY